MSNKALAVTAFIIGILVGIGVKQIISTKDKPALTDQNQLSDAQDPNAVKPDALIMPIKPDNTPRPVVSRADNRKSLADLKSQVTGFENRLASLSSDHTLLIKELNQAVALAENENAVKTTARLKTMIKQKTDEYKTDVQGIQRSLKRVKTIIRAIDKNKITDQSGTKAPVFRLYDSDDKMINLADYKGSIVVLQWLNPDSIYTRKYHQRKVIKKLIEKYKHNNIVWLGINSTPGNTKAQNAAFAKEYELKYPILNDLTGAIAGLYNVKVTPCIFIVDTKGIIAYNGAVDDYVPGRRVKQKIIRHFVDDALNNLVNNKPVECAFTRPFGVSVDQTM